MHWTDLLTVSRQLEVGTNWLLALISKAVDYLQIKKGCLAVHLPTVSGTEAASASPLECDTCDHKHTHSTTPA